MKEKVIKALLWIAVLPASALGSYLVYIIFYWLNSTKSEFTNADSIWNVVISLVSSALMGGAFVGIGSAIAPSWKRVTAIVLLCVVCILIGIAFIGNLMGGFSWVSLLSSLCIIAGAGFMTYSVFDNEK